MTKTIERKKYLDAAKGLGITMIIFGHITALGNPVDRYLSGYKITIFFVVSGYIIAMTGSMDRYSSREFIRRHLRGIMAPYVGYSAIILVYQLLVDLMKGRGPTKLLSRALNMGYEFITLRGHSTMWFLPCLFLAQILFLWIYHSPLWMKLGSAVIPIFSNLAFARLLAHLQNNLDARRFKLYSYPLLTISKAILAFWFVGAGFLLYRLLSRLSGKNLRFLLGLVLVVFNIWLSRYIRGVDLNNMKVGDPHGVFLLSGLAGSLGAILTLEGLERRWSMPYLTWAGKNSLILMATHGTLGFKNLCIRGWKSLYGLADAAGLRYYLQCVGIEIHLLLLEHGIVALVDRYLPALSGKGSGKKTA